jgi:hypothetical protein
MKTYIPVLMLCLVGCATVPSVHDASSALVAAQAVSVAVCSEPVPAELVEPCHVLAEGIAKVKAAADALIAHGVK